MRSYFGFREVYEFRVYRACERDVVADLAPEPVTPCPRSF